MNFSKFEVRFFQVQFLSCAYILFILVFQFLHNININNNSFRFAFKMNFKCLTISIEVCSKTSFLFSLVSSSIKNCFMMEMYLFPTMLNIDAIFNEPLNAQNLFCVIRMRVNHKKETIWEICQALFVSCSKLKSC